MSKYIYTLVPWYNFYLAQPLTKEKSKSSLSQSNERQQGGWSTKAQVWTSFISKSITGHPWRQNLERKLWLSQRLRLQVVNSVTVLIWLRIFLRHILCDAWRIYWPRISAMFDFLVPSATFDPQSKADPVLRIYSKAIEGSVKEAQLLNIYVYIYIKRNFDTYIHTVYFRRNFHIMELDLFW